MKFIITNQSYIMQYMFSSTAGIELFSDLDFVLHDLISWLSISQWKRKATEIEQICKLRNENVLFTMSQYIKKNVTFFNVLFSIS